MGCRARSIWRTGSHQGRHIWLGSFIALSVRPAAVNSGNSHAGTHCNADCVAHTLGHAAVDSFADAGEHFDANTNRHAHTLGDTAVSSYSYTGGYFDISTNGCTCADGDANCDRHTHCGTNSRPGKDSRSTGTEPKFI